MTEAAQKPTLRKKLAPRTAEPAPEAAATSAEMPVRKTLSPALMAVLKKSGGAMGAEAGIAEGVISTGYASLDAVLGGGWAKHRINELNGDSGAGKTTLALGTVAKIQRDDPEAIVAWLDPENSFVPELAVACGVDMDRLIYLGVKVKEGKTTRPRTGEEFCQFADEMVESGEVRFIVIDSVGALRPKKKMEKDYGEASAPALRAMLVGSLAEGMVGLLAGNDCTLLAINHQTGLLQTDFVGNQRTTSKGGKTWNYLKTVSITLKPAKTEEAGSTGLFAAKVDVEVLKCRRAPRGRKTTLLNVMGQGFSVLDDLIEVGLQVGVIEKAENSGWHTIGERRYNGRAAVLAALDADPALQQMVRDTVEAAA